MKRLALIGLLVIGLIAAGCSGDDAGETTAEEQANGQAAAERADEQRERAREQALEARVAAKQAERQRKARERRARAQERREQAEAQAEAEAEAERAAEQASQQAAQAEPDCPGVDINSASEVELQQIIHIGPDRAGQIVNMRPFTSIDSLTRVSGIAEVRLSEIKAQGLACVG